MKKTAVVLFNMGGPSSLKEVRPFLFNLFSDPAILRVPQPFRWALASCITLARIQKSKKIYALIGGKSPLLEQTERQAQSLEEALGENYKVFVAMRYSFPRLKHALKGLRTYQPSSIILVPLYPQFSTTTTQSSFSEWDKFMTCDVKKIYQYWDHPSFIAYWVEEIKKRLVPGMRILLVAHSIPVKCVKAGDPYVDQLEGMRDLIRASFKGQEVVLCYQSKIGPLAWVGPSIEEELKRAASDCVPVLIVPISFVSENSETLVELDIQHKNLARELGISFYARCITPGDHPLFIHALKELVLG